MNHENRLTFRPTRRTRLLIIAVVIAGLVGAALLAWNANRRDGRAQATAPPEASALQQRAMRQLSARAGQATGLQYSTERRGPGGAAILCGYAIVQPSLRPTAAERRAVRRVYAFVSLPDRVLTSRDPDFARQLGGLCPGLPGTPAPPPA